MEAMREENSGELRELPILDTGSAGGNTLVSSMYPRNPATTSSSRVVHYSRKARARCGADNGRETGLGLGGGKGYGRPVRGRKLHEKGGVRDGRRNRRCGPTLYPMRRRIGTWKKKSAKWTNSSMAIRRWIRGLSGSLAVCSLVRTTIPGKEGATDIPQLLVFTRRSLTPNEHPPPTSML